ncbi:MAG: extracellular solute-binding protein [Clostridia bacterium]|nr:extracellular solute-binding protein [Clostridia bacterium]
MKNSSKRLRKALAALLAAAFCVPLAGGCGKSPKTADEEKVKLTLWLRPPADALEHKIISNERMEAVLIEKFPDIEFDFKTQPIGIDYRQEYDKALMADTAPGFYTSFSYTDLPSRMENGTVADITEFVENWDLKKEGKVIDIFDHAISKNGKWYALPGEAYTEATLVNTKTIKSAGMDAGSLPKTWKEFAEFGVSVTDPSVPRIGYSLIGMDWCAWPFTAWVWSAGGEMVEPNEDGTYRVAFSDEPAVDAAVFLNEMIWKYKMTQKDVLADLGTVHQNLVNGTACFSWMSLQDLDVDELAEFDMTMSDFTNMAMPVKDASIPGPALAGGEVIAFNPKLSDKELETAWEVATWLYFSDERMQVMCDELKEFKHNDIKVPGRADWYDKKLQANVSISKEQLESLKELNKNAKPEPYCPHWSEIKSELVAPLQKIYTTEGITRDEVKRLLSECAEKIYTLYPNEFKK